MAQTNPTGRELPVVCTLGAGDLSVRRREWQALCKAALVGKRDTSSGVALQFRPDPDVEEELQRLAALERECCAFARWDVRDDGDAIVLDVSAAAEGVSAVRTMFAAA